MPRPLKLLVPLLFMPELDVRLPGAVLLSSDWWLPPMFSVRDKELFKLFVGLGGRPVKSLGKSCC